MFVFVYYVYTCLTYTYVRSDTSDQPFFCSHSCLPFIYVHHSSLPQLIPSLLPMPPALDPFVSPGAFPTDLLCLVDYTVELMFQRMNI